MRIQLSWTSLLFVVGACSFQASCGGKKLDMAKAKEFVTQAFEREVGQKPETTCPDSVKIEKGKTFECTAKFGTAIATIVIEQDDDKGNVTIKSATGILIASKLEKQIADHFSKLSSTHVEAACGERVRAAVAGATFQCDIKDDAGSSGKVNVTVKDTSGAVDFGPAK